MTSTIRTAAAAMTAALACSCATVYYDTMEKLGYEKRDIMVGRVQDARTAQEDAKDHFKDALTRFSAVVDIKGGKLEAKYKELSKAFERSEAKAAEVKDRIDAIETVAGDLFKEWQKELRQYSNANLRRESEKKLGQTKASYEKLMKTMRQTAATMDPVLSAFRDQVLFLKHNLNSQAIASIQGEAVTVQNDVAGLIRQMEASIAEADAFIASLKKP
jgi:hypothetical protein